MCPTECRLFDRGRCPLARGPVASCQPCGSPGPDSVPPASKWYNPTKVQILSYSKRVLNAILNADRRSLVFRVYVRVHLTSFSRLVSKDIGDPSWGLPTSREEPFVGHFLQQVVGAAPNGNEKPACGGRCCYPTMTKGREPLRRYTWKWWSRVKISARLKLSAVATSEASARSIGAS